MTQTEGSLSQLPKISLVVAMVSFAVLQYVAFVYAGSVLQYPLDDPFIHMAIAEQMRAGGYGVNAGEYAAAASSVLFPVLLLPFAGEAAQLYLPLFWNSVGLGLAAYFWGRILVLAGYGDGWIGLILAASAPLALHMTGLAFTGMEHALHLAASLAIVLGVMTFLHSGRIGALLVLGILLSPLLRFEGLALALAAAGVVTLRGRVVPGLGLAVLAVLPVALFVATLVSLGLEPFPSSISAKLATELSEVAGERSFAALLVTRVSGFLGEPQLVLLSFLLIALAMFLFPAVRRSNVVWLLAVVILAGFAHLAVAKFGWMDRYEIYILVTVAAGCVVAARQAGGLFAQLLPMAAMVGAGIVYMPAVLTHYLHGPRAIEWQQGQMSRFAKDHLQEPVAVNDLGLVSWRNPDYVLDLWGLANHEARSMRLSGDVAHWADTLATKHDVRLAMVYSDWFEADDLGPDWVLLGQLIHNTHPGYLGGRQVDFYLTGPIDPTPYLDKLRAWQGDLPKGAKFEFAEGVAQ